MSPFALPRLCMLLSINGLLLCGQVPDPVINFEAGDQIAVQIVDPYPINNKILVGGSGNTTVLTARVTPPDTGTYTWSYPRDLKFAPNGKDTAKSTTINTLPTPSPDTKNADKVQVVFASSDGKGNPTDQRPLNIVAPEHFAAKADPPKPVVVTIQLDKAALLYELINIRSDYTIEDKYKEELSSKTATFCGNSIQTRELVPWKAAVKLPPPTTQPDWKPNDSGTQTDQIFVPMKGTAIVHKGAFDQSLVGKDLVTIDPHAWQTRTVNTKTIYTVTNNTLHAVLTSISADGQTATITTTYAVNAL